MYVKFAAWVFFSVSVAYVAFAVLIAGAALRGIQ